MEEHGGAPGDANDDDDDDDDGDDDDDDASAYDGGGSGGKGHGGDGDSTDGGSKDDDSGSDSDPSGSDDAPPPGPSKPAKEVVAVAPRVPETPLDRVNKFINCHLLLHFEKLVHRQCENQSSGWQSLVWTRTELGKVAPATCAGKCCNPPCGCSRYRMPTQVFCKSNPWKSFAAVRW